VSQAGGNSRSRILFASLIGTTIEFFDFYIYATAAVLVFPQLFFPSADPASATLQSLATFALAFFARPVGSAVFGHFGDRIGRKATLVASLLLMGGCTLAIAFLPTYQMIGWFAPALLCLMRFGQGFGLGGEWGGAALLAVENAPRGWAARFGTAPQLGAPIGFMAANGLFLLLGLGLTEDEFIAWGWRVPFLASAALVIIGLWVRLRISETPEFRAAMEREPPVPVPLARLLTRHSGAMLAGSAGVVGCFALYYLTTAYALAQATGPLGYARATFLSVQLFANLFMAVGLVVAATIADRTSPRRMLLVGAVATVAVGFVFSQGLASGSLAVAGLTLCTAMFAMGFTSAPLGSWLSQLFPVRVRYSGVSFAFNTGGMIGGALTPIAAQLLSTVGAADYAGLLLAAAGLVTFAGVTLARPAEEPA